MEAIFFEIAATFFGMEAIFFGKRCFFLGGGVGEWRPLEGNKEHPKTQHTRKHTDSGNSRVPAFSGVLRFRVLFVIL